MKLITITVKYRKNARPIRIEIPVSENQIGIDELANRGANILSEKYFKWLKSVGKVDKKDLSRYRIGQYIMLKNKLKEIV